MKRMLTLLFLLGAMGRLMAQDQVINDKNAQPRSVAAFHAIRIQAGIDLYFSQGPQAVAVSASQPEYRDKIQTVVDNGVLKIYLQNTGSHLMMHNPRLRAYVSTPEITELRASGGSDVYLQGTVKSDKLDINLSGGSDLKGRLEIGNLYINQSGGSDVDISGTAANVTIEASGGSDFKGYGFTADHCDVEASGGSDTRVTVNKEITVRASGGSDVFYKGAGVVRSAQSSGSSSVKKAED